MKAQGIKHILLHKVAEKTLFSYRDFTILVDPEAKWNNEKCNNMSLLHFAFLKLHFALLAPFVAVEVIVSTI